MCKYEKNIRIAKYAASWDNFIVRGSDDDVGQSVNVFML